MIRLRTSGVGAVVATLIVFLPGLKLAAQRPPAAAAAPRFQVDPGWPKELPNNWILGAVTGVFVDAKDHIWVTHLPETLTEEETSAVQKPPIGTCCAPAPTVLELDTDGTVLQAWGDPAQDISVYPRNPHGIFVDHNDFVWIGTYMHHRVQKFTRDGKLVMTIGTYDKNAGSGDTTLLGGPAGIWVDPKSNEVFIADGYRNRRVIVFEGATGKYLRHWGAYGEAPDDTYKAAPNPDGPPPKQFSTVHGITGTGDGMIYVADRRGNRIQVFDQKGKFIREKIIAPRTLASGSAFVLVPSPDRAQQWLYMADGTNHKIWILRRSDLEIVGEFGHGGRQVGQMLRPHGMSVDSKGNLYVGEASTGRRVQRFVPQR
jgi:DNA-binding beta-propeller fold protein YncE